LAATGIMSPSGSTSFSEKLDPKAWRIIAVVILAPFMTQLDSTVVNVSLSSIQRDLHSSISSAQWIISGYLLALVLMLPLNGWFLDRVGAKRLYIFCFSAFTLASLLCGLSRTMPGLIGARVMQGVAGGLLAPLTQLMMARVAGKQMARVIGYSAVPILLAPLLGPLLAGAILKYAAWPWLFYINLPVGVLAVVLAIYLVPHDEAMIRKRPFDFAGFVTLSPGLTCLLYGFERASHHKGLSFLILGVILIGTFLLLARSKKEKALINIQLFRIRTFSVAATTQFLSSGIVYAGQFLVPLYLISGAGLSPARAGWVLSTMGIGMLCIYPLMGYLTDKFGCRTVAASGVLVNFLGTLPFVWMACTRLSILLSILGLLLRGMGQGATGIPSLAAAYASVPKESLSLATTAINIVQRVGAPIMTTAIAIVVALSQAGRSGAEPQAFFIPFIALIVCQLFVLGSASRLPKRIHQEVGVNR